MPKPLNITSTTPVSNCIKEIFNRAEHVKFKKNALFYQISAQVDAASGASIGNEASGQLFGFDTSKTSHHGLIRIRDKRTRILSGTAVIQEPGSSAPFDAYDWRTIIAFRFPMELNVEEIQGYVPGLGWKTVDLRNRRFWSQAPTDEEGIREFNSLKRSLAQVQYEREEVKKAREKGKKSVLEGNDIMGSHNNRFFLLSQTSGKTDKLFDKSTGDEVKKVSTVQFDKDIELIGNFQLSPVSVKRAVTPKDVADLAARFEVLGEVERHLSKAVRGIELGLIEDYMIGLNTDTLSDINGDTIEFADVQYTVSIKNARSYDYPENTIERWKAGELEMRTVDTKAQWRAREVTVEGVPVPQEEGEEAEVTQ